MTIHIATHWFWYAAGVVTPFVLLYAIQGLGKVVKRGNSG